MNSRLEISNNDEFRSWLASQTREVIGSMAARSALRALPAMGHLGSDLDNFAIGVFRACLTSVVANTGGGDDTSAAALSAGRAVSAGMLTSPIASAVRSAAAHAASASEYSQNKEDAVADAVGAMQCAVNSEKRSLNPDMHQSDQSNLVFEATTLDASHLSSVSMESYVFTEPLWHNEVPPPGLSLGYSGLRDFWLQDPAKWKFWQRWYEGHLKGKPIEFEVQHAISLLEENIWLGTASGLAQKIEEIEGRFDLNASVIELQTLMRDKTLGRHGIGGNNPPEPLDNLTKIPSELIVVWEPLEVIREETASLTPNPKLVHAALQVLKSIAISAGAWTTDRANVAIDTTIKVTLGTIGAAFVAKHSEQIVSVIEATLSWLSLLPI